MPIIESDGCPIRYEIEGPEAAPTLMFSCSLGTDLSAWQRQVAPFTRHFRVLRYDHRGHGGSGVTPGPYSIERLSRDALAVLDGLKLERVHWCGLSMGGMVGQWLGANAPERIGKLVLANTSSYFAAKDPWNERLAMIRSSGLASIADRVMGIWFTEDFRAREPQTVGAVRAAFVATPEAGYVACAEAVRDMDNRALLSRIAAPTLIIAGRYDASTPIDAAELIRSHIRGAQLTILETAHASNIEQPAAFNAEVLGFLLS